MDAKSEHEIGRGQSLLRHVNESIERGHWPGDEDAPVTYRCECAQLGCNDLVSMTAREYEQVRASPRRFVLAPGHEMPDIETVIATGAGYVVVEKREDSGRIAEAADPRD
jgi:hypothetical protein